jgi:hypothetical protein
MVFRHHLQSGVPHINGSIAAASVNEQQGQFPISGQFVRMIFDFLAAIGNGLLCVSRP